MFQNSHIKTVEIDKELSAILRRIRREFNNDIKLQITDASCIQEFKLKILRKKFGYYKFLFLVKVPRNYPHEHLWIEPVAVSQQMRNDFFDRKYKFFKVRPLIKELVNFCYEHESNQLQSVHITFPSLQSSERESMTERILQLLDQALVGMKGHIAGSRYSYDAATSRAVVDPTARVSSSSLIQRWSTPLDGIHGFYNDLNQNRASYFNKVFPGASLESPSTLSRDCVTSGCHNYTRQYQHQHNQHRAFAMGYHDMAAVRNLMYPSYFRRQRLANLKEENREKTVVPQEEEIIQEKPAPPTQMVSQLRRTSKLYVYQLKSMEMCRLHLCRVRSLMEEYSGGSTPPSDVDKSDENSAIELGQGLRVDMHCLHESLRVMDGRVGWMCVPNSIYVPVYRAEPRFHTAWALLPLGPRDIIPLPISIFPSSRDVLLPLLKPLRLNKAQQLLYLHQDCIVDALLRYGQDCSTSAVKLYKNRFKVFFRFPELSFSRWLLPEPHILASPLLLSLSSLVAVQGQLTVLPDVTENACVSVVEWERALLDSAGTVLGAYQRRLVHREMLMLVKEGNSLLAEVTHVPGVLPGSAVSLQLHPGLCTRHADLVAKLRVPSGPLHLLQAGSLTVLFLRKNPNCCWLHVLSPESCLAVYADLRLRLVAYTRGLWLQPALLAQHTLLSLFLTHLSLYLPLRDLLTHHLDDPRTRLPVSTTSFLPPLSFSLSRLYALSLSRSPPPL